MTTPQISWQGSNVKVIAGYALQQRLGSGSFATVYKGVKIAHNDNGDTADTVAVKVIARMSEKLTKKVLENLEMEIQILRTYHHPNIVCLQEIQKTERHFYLILEYCGGGDLQRLIRTRKAGRLSERLTRRLMRDLSAGLKFLWGQELIHRDIKPQNLLLTGPLPPDELNDPQQMDTRDEMRQQSSQSPSTPFSLKIADFGFARHLQTASLAETLCGSPLYMAPEILQHHRYDAKADLWSVGTVLFEMIAGRPPFNGENHIDLLRNIQRKAVRLPADVRVSQECVNLLRILLNRNPLSRAGFKEFFEACDAFVALGCEGVEGTKSTGTTVPSITMDLGTIHEVDQTTTHGAASMMTVATTAQVPSSLPLATYPPRMSPFTNPQPFITVVPTANVGFMTPPFGHLNPSVETTLTSARDKGQPRFAPLQPSPPPYPTAPIYHYSRLVNAGFQGTVSWHQPHQDKIEQNSQNSSDDSEFVMVNRSETLSPMSSGIVPALVTGPGITNQLNRRSEEVTKLPLSPPSSPSPRYLRPLQQQPTTSREEYSFVNDVRSIQVPMGMLSTSPSTGGALVAMMGGRARLVPLSASLSRLDAQIENASKIVAAAEDVGRRIISVAHLGDTCAYWAMKLVIGGDEGTSLLSNTPMEGVEEDQSDEHSSANVTDSDDSSSTAIACGRRRSVSTADRSMPDPNQEDDNEYMPFAMPSPDDEIQAVSIPTRTNISSNFYKGISSSQSKAELKPSPKDIRSRFSEALTCYLKALSMLKSVLGAMQRVKSDIEMTVTSSMTPVQRNTVQALVKRCDVTSNWLSRQFTSVLERADAANVEINKLPSSNTSSKSGAEAVISVEELIYTHSLACGRDAAVKQLLGQYDAARSCYRSAGLLAETLLMEPSVGIDDRKVLEGYVDGFASRIKEVDEILLQQSRSIGSTPGSSSISKRGSVVIGLIGGITPAKNADFDPVATAMQVSTTNT